jgi:hypothetical protein
MVVEELRNRAHGILEEIERLKAEINQLKEDTQGLPNNNNLSKDLESAIGFLGRAEIDLERGYGKIHESTKLIAQWQKENHAFVRAMQVELMFDEQGKVTAISPDGCSFMIPEGIDPVGKYLKEIQCAGSHRVLGWYGSKEVVNYRALCEGESVITVGELRHIMPSLELQEAA